MFCKKGVLRNFAKFFIKKETLAQVFSGEFCEISKNTVFIGHGVKVGPGSQDPRT